jgi:hypothetical protein
VDPAPGGLPDSAFYADSVAVLTQSLLVPVARSVDGTPLAALAALTLALLQLPPDVVPPAVGHPAVREVTKGSTLGQPKGELR